jgi:tRNA nucleotidyltransferase/poly(A) polymerase
MPPITEREFAVEVVRTLKAAGHQALFAGGCVRDELLGLTPKDHDVATSALPDQVQGLFRRTIAVGASFGVVEVLGPRPHKIQVATFRNDGNYTDARRPDSVTFSTAEEDAQRRDFTINGLFLDPTTGDIFDYVGGREDLKNGVLRAIGDPFARFREDRLRLLRAVRIAARFVLTFDPGTWDAVKTMAPKVVEGVSPERIAEELRKTLTNPNRARAMRLFKDLHLADAVLPELPSGEAWEATLAVLDELHEDADFPLAMAALLADAGHVEEIAERLRLSNDEAGRIGWLVANRRTLLDAPAMRPARLKPLLVHPGIAELFALHRAAGHDVEGVEALRNRWAEEGALDPPPLLTGHDLMAMGLTPGPIFKQLLDRVREAQLDGEISTRDQAEALVRASA